MGVVKRKAGVVKKKSHAKRSPQESLADAVHRLGVPVNKAKTHKGRLHLARSEPHLYEEPRKIVCLRASTCKPTLRSLLHDLTKIHTPNSLMLSRKREGLDPFTDHEPLEFLCRKNFCALYCFGHSNKKRPQRLVFGRVYEDALLDMYEAHVLDYEPLSNYTHVEQSILGSKPLVIAQGSEWDVTEETKFLRNALLDFFANGNPRKIVTGKIDCVITLTAVPSLATAGTHVAGMDIKEWQRNPHILFRRYRLHQRSDFDEVAPESLIEIGPRFTLHVERNRIPDKDVWKAATTVPPQLKPKKKKNVSKSGLGETQGRLHVGRQNFDSLHTPHYHGKRGHRLRDDQTAAVDASTDAESLEEV